MFIIRNINVIYLELQVYVNNHVNTLYCMYLHAC